MPVVSIEADARYRRDGDRYIEVCRDCGADRTGDRCACGAELVRIERKFLTLRWTPAPIEPVMPDQCPHCGGKPARTRSVTMILPTAWSLKSGATYTRKTIELETCAKVPPPFLSYLGFLTGSFFTVVFVLAAMFGGGVVPAVIAALALAGAVLGWRAYGWVRFAGFDHRSVRLRVRRAAYARALAEANRGRIV